MRRREAQIADETNELWFSVASVWEMGIKVAIGKLLLKEPLDSYISSRMAQLGARSLSITAVMQLLPKVLSKNHSRVHLEKVLLPHCVVFGYLLMQ